MKKTYSKPMLSVLVKAKPIHESRQQRSAEEFLQRWQEEGKAVRLATGRQIEALLRMHFTPNAMRPSRG